MVGYSKGAKAPFSARRGLSQSMQESIVQPHSMVTPCPDRLHTRCELFLIGLLEALPVCPMAPLVFIDFLSGPPGALRSASCRFRRGSARQMGSRPVYWTSSNLQGCILSYVHYTPSQGSANRSASEGVLGAMARPAPVSPLIVGWMGHISDGSTWPSEQRGWPACTALIPFRVVFWQVSMRAFQRGAVGRVVCHFCLKTAQKP